jgi:hypothetical protein
MKNKVQKDRDDKRIINGSFRMKKVISKNLKTQ